VEIKYQLDATDGFFIADLIACATCFMHQYGHHQELKSIIQVVALKQHPAQTRHTTHSSTPDRQLENQSTKYHRQQVTYILTTSILFTHSYYSTNVN